MVTINVIMIMMEITTIVVKVINMFIEPSINIISTETITRY